MNVIRLYHTFLARIRHRIPTGHAYRARNLAWLMTGIYHSKSVHLSKIANKIPGKAQRESRTRRLLRFVDNAAVRVRDWYRPVAVYLLQAAAKTGQIRLIIDATQVAQNYQLLIVTLAYRRRALPIAWTWLRSGKGHSSGWKQAALLTYVRSLMPPEVSVVVVGDSEFSSLQAVVEAWGWFYVLRQKGSHLFRERPDAPWRRLDSLLAKPGQQCWLTNVELTQEHRRPCNLLAYWKRGEKDPWLLATNLPTAQQTRGHYRLRMWVDEMFGDFKGNGFDLARSRLHHFLRLSRLTLAVALLYLWLVAFGSATIKNGRRKEVDRSDRRDLSIFRIGFDMFERCLVNNWRISIRDAPYFT
jgi:hypothetical protein